MVITCWSVKGGSGTTVVASSLALLLASYERSTVLLDFCGDSAPSLGCVDVDPCDPGDFEPAPQGSASQCHTRTSAFEGDLGAPVTEYLTLLNGTRIADARQRAQLVTTLDRRAQVVVDAGTSPHDLPVQAGFSLLVTRPCFLSMRRLAQSAHRPHGIVLIAEPGRALSRCDVENVAGAPVVAEISWDPAVARTIDAGLLVGRLPAALSEPLGALHWLR